MKWFMWSRTDYTRMKWFMWSRTDYTRMKWFMWSRTDYTRMAVDQKHVLVYQKRIFLIKSADFHSSKARIIFASKARIYL